MSGLLNKLGLLAGKVYTLEDLRTLMSPPEEKKVVKVNRDSIITGYIISELNNGELNRMFVSRSYEESVQKLLEWTGEGKDKTEYTQVKEEMTNASSKEDEEKEGIEEEGEWITVSHRGKGRHNRRGSSGVGSKGDHCLGDKAEFLDRQKH